MRRGIANILRIGRSHIRATHKVDVLLGQLLVLAGLEPLSVCKENNFVNVGERCNVAGSRKFLRLINEKSYNEALSIALISSNDTAFFSIFFKVSLIPLILSSPTKMYLELALLHISYK